MKLLRLVVLACVVSFAVPSARVAFADPDVAKLQQQRIDAAAKVYASAVAGWKASTATVDSVYNWSTRWLDSVIDANGAGAASTKAFADHVARMTEVSKYAQQRVSAGLAGPSEAEAAAYFLVEAQLWAARGHAH